LKIRHTKPQIFAIKNKRRLAGDAWQGAFHFVFATKDGLLIARSLGAGGWCHKI